MSGQESIRRLSEQLAEARMSVNVGTSETFAIAASHAALICELVCLDAACSTDVWLLFPERIGIPCR